MAQDSSRDSNEIPADILEVKTVLESLNARSWVSPRQVSDLLGVKYNTVIHWVRDQKLKATRVGGNWRIYSEALKDFLKIAGYQDILEEAEAAARTKEEQDAAQGIRPLVGGT